MGGLTQNVIAREVGQRKRVVDVTINRRKKSDKRKKSITY